MARLLLRPQSRWQGIAYSEKEGLRSSVLFAKSTDYREDPTKLKLLPRTEKISGSVVTDLILDGDRDDATGDIYLYGDAGNIYKRTTADVFTNLRTVSDSNGNGMIYYGEDGYLYYTSDKVIGRYGPFGGTKEFADDFLGAEGGIPLNTASMDFEASSSMYATAADSASNSITGDLTLSGCFKFESLPAAAAQMVLVSKWTKQNDDRSYMLDIAAVDAVFGDGGDGALTIAANTTQVPTDSACTGTAAAYSLTATNTSFATGDKLLIIQSRGTGAGKHEENEIASYTAGTITLANALQNTYTALSQVIVFPEYTNVTVNSAKTWTAKAWNGTVGGILIFKASGTVTVTGTINANGGAGASGVAVNNTGGGSGGGFRGGNVSYQVGIDGPAYTGEGTVGATSAKNAANGNGGGGGTNGGGGGGGHGTVGTTGFRGTIGGVGGGIAGSADLTTLVFGGGGGGGGKQSTYAQGGGGSGGGIIFFYGATITITGLIRSNGGAGGNGAAGPGSAGGGGAGGSVLLKAQTATLGTNKITATAGAGGTGGNNGGPGGVGRIHLDYYTSYTGTTNPTLNATQDDGLVTTTVYQLRLSVSSDGTAANSEILAKEIVTPTLAQWYRYTVTWDASESTAEFFIAGVSVGSATGAVTSISDNASLFAIAASFDAAGDDENHFDGKGDDIRVFNDIRTDGEIALWKDVEIPQVAGLVAYYEVDSSTADSSANSNTLTLVNSPTYDTDDVPFSSPTARRDLDQSLDTSGNTYTVPVAIDEGATARQSFVPAKDPQKSIEALVADAGSGDWTVTVHDALNREIATATIVNANVVVGDNEFIFSTSWRPIIGATYHFHLTSTVADGTVTTTTTADLETVDFHTYYQFLVDETDHPIRRFLDMICIGNERYLATYDAATYTPHRLTLPSGYKIRCLGTWRGYLAIGAYRGDSFTDYDRGKIFLWDGYNTTYNDHIDVPEGGINSILSGDPMYFMAGYSGDFMKFEGGRPKKIRRMPKVATADTLEINRNSLAMWKALVHIGFGENSTSTGIERGVYSWGTLHREVEETLSFDYPLSLGVTQNANIDIGMVLPIGSDLLISWRNGSAYGMDKVSPSNAPYASGYTELLIRDADKIWAEKQAHVARGYFKKLVDGDGVKLKYKIDRNDSWTEGATDAKRGYATTADEKEARLPLPTKANRFNEIQLGVILETTNTTSPEFYGIALEIDEMQRERRT